MTKKAVFWNCLHNNPKRLYKKATTPHTDTQRLLHISKLFPNSWFALFYINFCQAVGQGGEQWDCRLECQSAGIELAETPKAPLTAKQSTGHLNPVCLALELPDNKFQGPSPPTTDRAVPSMV